MILINSLADRRLTEDPIEAGPLLELSSRIRVRDCPRLEVDALVQERKTCLHGVWRVEQLAARLGNEVVEDNGLGHARSMSGLLLWDSAEE